MNHDDKQVFVEESGLFFERMGLMRMSGRVMGWLLICGQAQQTMGDIQAALQASKSATSTALKQLLSAYLVEKLTLPGERRDYYRLSYDVWQRSFEAKMAEFAQFTQLAERGLAILSERPAEERQRLILMRDMYDFMNREFRQLLAKWDEEKQRRSDEP